MRRRKRQAPPPLDAPILDDSWCGNLHIRAKDRTTLIIFDRKESNYDDVDYYVTVKCVYENYLRSGPADFAEMFIDHVLNLKVVSEYVESKREFYSNGVSSVRELTPRKEIASGESYTWFDDNNVLVLNYCGCDIVRVVGEKVRINDRTVDVDYFSFEHSFIECVNKHDYGVSYVKSQYA